MIYVIPHFFLECGRVANFLKVMFRMSFTSPSDTFSPGTALRHQGPPRPFDADDLWLS